MIRHIVLFKLREGLSRADAQVVATREALADLGPTLPMVRAWEVRQCFGDKPASHDFILISEFDDEADLAQYAVDPDHQVVVAKLDSITAGKATADFHI
jgi:Stress responsive A/B Barrel Domain